MKEGVYYDDARLQAFRDALKADPTNLESAHRYWRALSDGSGNDPRTGGHVVDAYEAAALTSKEGVVALCAAFKELYDVSGESPRRHDIDADLLRALRSALEQSAEPDKSVIGWTLSCIEAK